EAQSGQGFFSPCPPWFSVSSVSTSLASPAVTADRRPLLLHAFSSFAVGGAQVRFAALANRYPHAWRHAIVAMDGNLECRERLSPEVDAGYPEIGLRKGDTFGNVRRL